MNWPIDVAGAGAFTAVGLTALETAASVRAGICRVQYTGVTALGGDTYRAAFVSDEYVPASEQALPGIGRDSEAERLIRLAAPALREACQAFDYERPPPALFLGIADSAQLPANDASLLLESLSRHAEVRLDLAESRVFAAGRTAGLAAVLEACARLSDPSAPPIIAGGVDSYRDVDRLTRFDFDGRILTEANLDGFLPGEGAGFVLLARPGDRAVAPAGGPLAVLVGGARGFEKGHLGSSEPMLGDGLTQTLAVLFASVPRERLPCRAVIANLNGESWGAKQWGIALLRNQRFIAEKHELVHPAECFGEAGAAMGPIMVAVAAHWLKRGVRTHPFLVWCAADDGPCAACYLAPNIAVERKSHVRAR